MSEVTLHPAPRLRDVVLEQVWIVGLSLRREALVFVAVLVAGTFMIVGDFLGGGPGFDSAETFPTPLISFLFPFAVWRGARRFGPDFLWTLPVDRRRLALAKVFGGLVWLLAALAVFITWLFAQALLVHASPGAIVIRVPVIATIATYLFGSALVLGLRHPLRWLIGTAGVLALMGKLSDVFSRPDDSEWDPIPLARAFFSAVERAAAVWQTLPDPARWAISTFLLLGAGLAALWAAAWRHRERRRH